jgi:S-formylglutathione hydrolase
VRAGVAARASPGRIRIDQGLGDKFLAGAGPQLFAGACAAAGQDLVLCLHEGYDHSYYFISSFVEAHLRHHAAALVR